MKKKSKPFKILKKKKKKNCIVIFIYSPAIFAKTVLQVFVLFLQFRPVLVLDQSSPVHPISEYREGTMSMTDGRKQDRQISLCLILDILLPATAQSIKGIVIAHS